MSKFLKVICSLIITIYIGSFIPVFAEEGHKQEKSKKLQVYICPVDKCDYHKSKPGKCPKHKKELVKGEVIYRCPKCGMKFDEPGKCSMDGAELKPEIVKEKQKSEGSKSEEHQHKH